jgi:hypothetical protein
MVLRTVACIIGKPVGAVMLGGVILWHVADRAVGSKGQAIVHVSTLPADLVVDQAVYRVVDWGKTPIVCDLRAGRHSARLIKDGRVVYQEEFLLRGGEEVILNAWDGYDDGRSPGRSERNVVAREEHRRAIGKGPSSAP